jgi:type IX secretion system PorP/SprF family membrane protein
MGLLGGGAYAQVLSPNPNYHIQTFNNLYQLNPAMAGSNNELTGFLTYHQQIISGFEDTPRQISLTADAPFTRTQDVAFGGSVYTYRRSILQSTGMSGTFAKKLTLGKKWHTLRLGVTAGFYYNSINPDGVNIADPAIARLNNKIQPDVAFGFNYQLKGFQFGLSLPKLMSFATVQVNDGGSASALRISPLGSRLVYFFYDAEVNPRWSVRPMVVYRSMDNAWSGLEMNVRALYEDKFWFGAAWRQQFGAAAFAGFKAKKLSVSYAYKAANSAQWGYANPAHEVQLGMYLGRLGKVKKVARGGARLNTNDSFTASRVRKSKSAEVKKPGGAKPTAGESTATQKQTEKLPGKSPDKKPTTKLKVESLRKGESANDLAAGNYLVAGSYKTEAEAKKEQARLKRELGKQNYEVKTGYHSDKKLYYVYVAEGGMEDVSRRGEELKKKKGFGKVYLLKITNRPHGESLE